MTGGRTRGKGSYDGLGKGRVKEWDEMGGRENGQQQAQSRC